MRKSVKAFLLGYLFFKVNDKSFLLYHLAKNESDELKEENGKNIIFQGFNIFHFIKDFLFPQEYQIILGYKKGWKGFFIRQIIFNKL